MVLETINIDSLAFGGAGVGRINGKVCFVPLTAPGDKAAVSIAREKSSYLMGELQQILSPAPCRVTPPCSIFGRCGGCQWQHIGYGDQLLAKHEILCEQLWRIARIPRELVAPVLPAPGPFGYRTRIQLKLRYVAGELKLGFYRGGSHYVDDLPGSCAIARHELNLTASDLRLLMTRFPEPERVPQVDLAVGDDGGVIAVFHYIGENPSQVRRFLKEWHGVLSSCVGVLLQCGRKSNLECISGVDRLTYRCPRPGVSGGADLNLAFAGGGFSQVNYQQNARLVETVVRRAELTGTERVLDLYCGNGNFSLPLALLAGQVVGVEEFPSSVSEARRNAEQNGINNIDFRAADAETGCRELAHGRERFDLILLDPPRSGATDVVRLLPGLGAGVVIYVSCDPPTLARDLALLCKRGYEVVACQPVDMFPQTYHLESVTVLKRVS